MQTFDQKQIVTYSSQFVFEFGSVNKALSWAFRRQFASHNIPFPLLIDYCNLVLLQRFFQQDIPESKSGFVSGRLPTCKQFCYTWGTKNNSFLVKKLKKAWNLRGKPNKKCKCRNKLNWSGKRNSYGVQDFTIFKFTPVANFFFHRLKSGRNWAVP